MNLHLLGTPRLAESRLEPARAALLAYVALEGQASRARLTRLLWPHRPAKTARNNLRKQISRLRDGYPEPCLAGLDPLKLAGELSVDVLLLRSACERKDYRSAIHYTGDFLADLHLDAPSAGDGCGDEEPREELLHWLDATRSAVRGMQVLAHTQEIERLERERKLPEALDLAQRLCQLDETREEAWRAVMRLNFRMGDRSAALDAFRACEHVLCTRLDAEPSEETLALARAIRRQSDVSRSPVRPVRPQVPLSVTCPPRLVGREREWGLLEEACESGRPAFVFGEAGLGKSRLITEFACSRGTWLQLEARPGDQGVPYATRVRNAQKLLERRRSDGRPPLPAWVTEPLAPLLPALGPGRGVGTAREDKVKLVTAMVELFCDTCRDMDAIVFDDGQYSDPESFKVGLHLLHQLELRRMAGATSGRKRPMIICAYRESQLEPRRLELMREMVRQGLATWIELRPLGVEDVRAMLRSMEVVPQLDEHAEELARHTGGNPLALVELVTHLVASGTKPAITIH